MHDCGSFVLTWTSFVDVQKVPKRRDQVIGQGGGVDVELWEKFGEWERYGGGGIFGFKLKRKR